MRKEILIAHRLNSAQTGEGKEMSRPAVRVAFIGIVIGIVVMLLSLFIIVGFKQTITDKVIGTAAHVQIINSNSREHQFQLAPFCISDSLTKKIRSVNGVKSFSAYASQPAMLKTQDEFQTVIYKGYPTDDEQAWQYIQKSLIGGRLPQENNEIVISSYISDILGLPLDTSVFCYFISDNVKARKYKVTGIYNTDFSNFDNRYILGSLSEIQHINRWSEDEVSGIEVQAKSNNRADIYQLADDVYFSVAYVPDRKDNYLTTENIIDLYPDIFSWLDLLDMNVVVIIILMLVVAGFSIISGLIIIILESTQNIGILKAIGADNRFLRRMFFFQFGTLVIKGLLLGNIIALSLAAIQYFTHIIPLDATAYYVSYVPISFCWQWGLLLDVATLLVCGIIMYAPLGILKNISTASVLRFE